MMVQDASIDSDMLLEHYRLAYLRMNRREPVARYLGNNWYHVNGETVHYLTLEMEVRQLQDLARRQSLQRANGSVIKRLIDRLRAL